MSLKESGRYISRLILISQSKRIEVSEGTFENPGSYIQTLTGKLSEDSDDDFKVYTIQNRFEKSKSSQLNLKFTGIQDSCWILNLVVITMVIWVVKFPMDILKFIYSEKATKFCEISTIDLSYVVPVKFTVEISQNFVAF